MKYVEEDGTVVSVSDEVATVRLDEKVKEACGSCCACSAYQSGEQTIEVDADGLEKGDRVRTRIPRINPYLSIFLVFVLPLALFMGGIAIGQQIQGGERLGTESAIGGIVGLIVALLVAVLMNHLLTRNESPTAHPVEAEEK